jgi:hypothetical protein
MAKRLGALAKIRLNNLAKASNDNFLPLTSVNGNE